MTQILHNPRCGKSRTCLLHLENKSQDFEIIEYLKNPLNYSQIDDLLKKMNVKPIAIIRTKEQIWIDNFKDKKLTDKEMIQAIVDFPILLERPIVIKENTAFIARTLESLELI